MAPSYCDKLRTIIIIVKIPKTFGNHVKKHIIFFTGSLFFSSFWLIIQKIKDKVKKDKKQEQKYTGNGTISYSLYMIC